METTGHFFQPSADDCRLLLSGHSVGRVAWMSRLGLQVLPVTYRFTQDTILFRVDPSSVLGELAAGVEVAFEVDDIDLETASGWSVVIHGTTSSHPEDPFEELPPPWAPGERHLVVAIQVGSYSCRAVSAQT